jgi:glucosylceramidase
MCSSTNNGSCSKCQGAITIDGDKVSRNLAFYTVVHASKFVRPGSVRIASTNTGENTISLTEDEERPGLGRLIHLRFSTKDSLPEYF